MPKVNIDKDKCTGCGACVEQCPQEVFELKEGKAEAVNESSCVGCKLCEGVCPVEAINIEDE